MMWEEINNISGSGWNVTNETTCVNVIHNLLTVSVIETNQISRTKHTDLRYIFLYMKQAYF
jgi:uncharacterized protein YfkK (UPF0435 family)